MKVFDGLQNFFNSLGEYVKNFSNLFLVFLGAFALVSVVVIFITSFSYECKLTKTIDKINKFLERNPRINDDNLVAFNNLMKASSVPKTLRRQWQQFMLYREHPASYYMSFKHCVENPMRNSAFSQQMTVYRIISYVLVALSLVVSTFMAVQSFNSNLVLQDIVIIPITILVLYWVISMVLNLIHNAISGDLFQNYQYFEINMDKAMLTLPEFVDYEVLFSQDEIRRGIPVLFAYLQKRAIQEQQELEKARLKSVDHEKFDFDQAGLDGSLVLDRAMRETENFASQRKKYMQEIERVNNEIATLEHNYKEQTKEFQRQVQTSKETVENLKEQLEQASSTIEINYIKKQMRDELNREQMSEKEFDILTDKHNQEIKTLNQEIKHYEDETKKAKEALEVAMLSEFNTYSVKVYDSLEKVVDDKMQKRVDNYKDSIKGLEIELEEKNEELENVYSRYQEVLAQLPEEQPMMEEQPIEEIPVKKGKKKKKGSEGAQDGGFVQPAQTDYSQEDYQQYPLDDAQQYSEADYSQDSYGYDNQYNDGYEEQYDQNTGEYVDSNNDYYGDQNYVPLAEDGDNYQGEGYVPLDDYAEGDYIPLDSEAEYQPQENGEYVAQEQNFDGGYIPLDQEAADNYQYQEEYKPQENQEDKESSVEAGEEIFDDSDFNIDFGEKKTDDFENLDFDFDFGEEKQQETPKVEEEPKVVEEDIDFDINDILSLYGSESKEEKPQENEEVEEAEAEQVQPIKRKAGRPRKIVDESEIKPKRKAGRPRKVVEEQEVEKPKRKAGRPRKVIEQVEEQPKRRAGRPRKVVEEQDIEQPKRKAGRPRKVIEELEEQPKRRAGRPRKIETKVETKPQPSTIKRGRPKKSGTEVKENSSKVGRGRPRKTTEIKQEVKKAGRGRPKKQASVSGLAVSAEGVLGKPKRRVGRPRKDK